MSAKSFYYEIRKSPASDDRSDASSIPWNSDAIKQNKHLWEFVERMLYHEEAPPEDEPELRQEILDWQLKFPQLSKTKATSDWTIKRSTFNTSSTNASETHDLSSSPDNESIEDDDGHAFQEELEFLEISKAKTQIITKRHHLSNRDEELAKVFDKDLHITPLTLRQRKSERLLEQQQNFSTTSSISDSPTPAKGARYKNLSKSVMNSEISTTENVASAKNSQRFYMPPLLNVLDSKRRFCTLGGNRSFVQLTQIQQAKSAAVHSAATRLPPSEQQFRVWNKPLAAVTVNSRFFNNRNAIILPTLRHQFVTAHNSSNQGDSRSRQFNSFSTSNSSVSSGDIRGRQRMHCLSNTQTTTSSGRSISAVPMHLHGAFYHL